MKPFEVVEHESPHDLPYLSLSLRGYLDAHTVGEFEDYMDRAIEKGNLRYLIDISDLNYMSSAGIGAIMSLTQRLRRENGDIVLLRPNERVYKILEKLGFTKIFRFAHSREQGEKLLGLKKEDHV